MSGLESTSRIVEAIREGSGRPDLRQRKCSPNSPAASSAASSTVESLATTELQVFRRLGEGLGTRQIADELHVSIKTVQAYCSRIKEKLGLTSGAILVRDAVRWVEQTHRK